MPDLSHHQEEKNVVNLNNPSIVLRASSPSAIAFEKRVWRKLDLYIVPIVAVYHLLGLLGHTSIGNARIAGLQEDLEITNGQYSMALTVTYIAYIIAEFPASLLLRLVGPDILLATMITLWGVVTTFQGINYSGLLAVRFFLGLLEGGMAPGIVLYLSLFYPRHKLNSRMTVYSSMASLSGAFAGILAFGITKIKESPTQTRPGWAWVFIIEGISTVLFGLAFYILLPRSPRTTRLLTAEERDFVTRVLQEDTVADDDSFSWRDVSRALVSPQVMMMTVISFSGGVVSSGLIFFIPSIIVGLGYTASAAQLMSIPPYAASFVIATPLAIISDRYKCRGILIIVSSILCIIGFAIFLGSDKHAVQYGSLFFSISGLLSMSPVITTWSSNNSAPHTRRASTIAVTFIFYNSGSVLAIWLLGSLSTGLRYHRATIILLAFAAGIGLFAAANIAYLARQNRLKAEVRRTLPRVEEKKGLGDQSAWFEYIL